MKITFVALGAEQLAISLLSAILKREGHQVNLAYSASLFNDRYNLEIEWLGKLFDDTDQVIKAIREQQPDVLAFSPLTSTYQWMLAVAEQAKAMFPHIKTIWGGVHVSAVPDRVLAKPVVDYVVVGEGEVALPAIIDRIENGYSEKPIPNTRFKNKKGQIVRGPQCGFIQDLDLLPAYDKTLWEDHIRVGDLWLTMASRGCPYRCTFCFNNFFAELPDDKKTRGKYVRHRSVDHMMEELTHAKNRYNIKMVNFQDDVFTVNKVWLKEFLQRYKMEINVPFQCLTHPKYMDDEVAQWMVDAGGTYVQMGVQSMDDGHKRNTLKRYEKGVHIEDALVAMRKAGLKPKVDHMFGLPGEPLSAQEIARKLYANATPMRIQTFWTCFLPGTEMMNEAIAAGELTDEQIDRIYEGKEFYFYRNEQNVQDKEMGKTYLAYEFMFKIFPLLPHWLRTKLRVAHVKWMPPFLNKGIATVVDLILGLYNLNPEFWAYAKHNLFHLYSFSARKLGLPTPKASKPNKNYRPRPHTAPKKPKRTKVVVEA